MKEKTKRNVSKKQTTNEEQKLLKLVLYIGGGLVVLVTAAILIMFFTDARLLTLTPEERECVRVVQNVYDEIGKPKDFKLGEVYVWPVDLSKVAPEYQEDAAMAVVYFSYTTDTKVFGAEYIKIVCDIMKDGTLKYEDVSYYELNTLLEHMDPWVAMSYVMDDSYTAEAMFEQRINNIIEGGTPVFLSDVKWLLR